MCGICGVAGGDPGRERARVQTGHAGWITYNGQFSIAIRELVAEHARQVDDPHVRLWQLVSLDAWHRIYLGGEPVAAIYEPSSRMCVA
jgi:hypothetical protein